MISRSFLKPTVGIVVAALTVQAWATNGEPLEKLYIEVPKPEMASGPVNLESDNLDPNTGNMRSSYITVPAGTRLLSRNRPVTASAEPLSGRLPMVTDGVKEHKENQVVELPPGVQWAQIDLGRTYELQAILVWHYHRQARIYRDFVVRVSDDKNFAEYAELFNNDHDNSSGLGVGSDYEYVETNEGKLIDAKGTNARYVRLYSNGNTSNDMNHMIEVEVYGRYIEPLEELDLVLPRPTWSQGPMNFRSPNLDPNFGGQWQPFMVPVGTRLLSLNKPVTASAEPVLGKPAMVTDGIKDHGAENSVKLPAGVQWVQIDLGEAYELEVIAVWHEHSEARVYHDVIVRVSNDEDFAEYVELYNNDHDNSSGLGAGSDYEYIETNRARFIDAIGARARYVRLYSNGYTDRYDVHHDTNHIIEVEVYGR